MFWLTVSWGLVHGWWAPRQNRIVKGLVKKPARPMVDRAEREKGGDGEEHILFQPHS